MKLTELNPRWVGVHNMDSSAQYFIGVSFDSPIGTGRRLAVLFTPPIDPQKLSVKYGWAEPFLAEKKWGREGDSFEALSLTPSLDFSKCEGEWHGCIVNGEIL